MKEGEEPEGFYWQLWVKCTGLGEFQKIAIFLLISCSQFFECPRPGQGWAIHTELWNVGGQRAGGVGRNVQCSHLGCSAGIIPVPSWVHWCPLSSGDSGIGLTLLGLGWAQAALEPFQPHQLQCSISNPSIIYWVLIPFKFICIFPFVWFLDLLTQSSGSRVQQPGGREGKGRAGNTHTKPGGIQLFLPAGFLFITQKLPPKLLLATAHAGG